MLPAVAAISKGKVAKAFLPFYLFTLLPLKIAAAIHHGPQNS